MQALLRGPELALFVLSPNQRACPIPFRERPVIGDRGSLPVNIPRLELLRMDQAPKAVLRRPVASRSDADARRPGIQRSKIERKPILIRLAAVECGRF